ncbi:hypothetical protein [Mesorhizobium sp. M0058]|uniref:hypothetical protein n=1 Tax=Mesorhizobium sp. M0058 TaxID=2956865 RepID=UPI0033354334
MADAERQPGCEASDEDRVKPAGTGVECPRACADPDEQRKDEDSKVKSNQHRMPMARGTNEHAEDHHGGLSERIALAIAPSTTTSAQRRA